MQEQHINDISMHLVYFKSHAIVTFRNQHQTAATSI